MRAVGPGGSARRAAPWVLDELWTHLGISAFGAFSVVVSSTVLSLHRTRGPRDSPSMIGWLVAIGEDIRHRERAGTG